jgi:hypothetical protein
MPRAERRKVEPVFPSRNNGTVRRCRNPFGASDPFAWVTYAASRPCTALPWPPRGSAGVVDLFSSGPLKVVPGQRGGFSGLADGLPARSAPAGPTARQAACEGLAPPGRLSRCGRLDLDLSRITMPRALSCHEAIGASGPPGCLWTRSQRLPVRLRWVTAAVSTCSLPEGKTGDLAVKWPERTANVCRTARASAGGTSEGDILVVRLRTVTRPRRVDRTIPQRIVGIVGTVGHLCRR